MADGGGGGVMDVEPEQAEKAARKSSAAADVRLLSETLLHGSRICSLFCSLFVMIVLSSAAEASRKFTLVPLASSARWSGAPFAGWSVQAAGRGWRCPH